MLIDNCLKGTLATYVPSPEKPWNEKRVRHLYNKLCSGATASAVEAALKVANPADLVKNLFAKALSHPLPGVKNAVADYSFPAKEMDIPNYHYTPPPNYPPLERDRDYRFQFTTNNYNKHLQLYEMWMDGMVSEGLRHKLVLFWSNHFVSVPDGTTLSWNFQYYYMLHYFALGNFKDFVFHIGRTPLMLIYLSGYVSGPVPNNNYARELLELFTMGPGNYTEKDIVEIARALTGWGMVFAYSDGTKIVNKYQPVKTADFTRPDVLDNYYFRGKYYHDFGKKVIMGETISGRNPSTEAAAKIAANSDYRDVHDIIFRQRPNEIAKFICRKLYKFYLYQYPSEEILTGLAEEFKKSWSIQDVLIKLFTSDHFFSEECMGLNIKSPFDMMIGHYRNLGLKLNEDYFIPKENTVTQAFDLPTESKGLRALIAVFNQNVQLGQQLFSPPNVAGWQMYRSWLNENTLVLRWQYYTDQLFYYLQLTETKEKYRSLLKDLSNNSSDPDYIVRKFIEHYLAVPLDEEYIEQGIGIFKAGIPSNYYTNGTWSLDYSTVPNQCLNLMQFLSTLPEFQLI